MKHILLLLASLFAALTWSSLYLNEIDVNGERALKSPLPVMVKNISLSPLQLYPESPTQVSPVASFAVGEVLPFRYQGQSGQRFYVVYNGSVLSVRDGEVAKGVFLQRRFIRFSDLSTYAFFMAVILASTYLIALLVSKALRTKEHRNQKVMAEQVASLTSEVQRKNMELSEAHKRADLLKRKLNEKEAQTQSTIAAVLVEKESVDQEKQALEQELIRQKNINESNQQRLIEDYERKLRSSEAIQREFEHKTTVTVAQLEQSLENVKSELDNLLADIRTFDIDYQDARFNGILKGRQFEIYVAKALVEQFGCEILEWTPDKGFLHDLQVVQNGNPDLLFMSRSGVKFAIECKFRSGYSVIGDKDPKLDKWVNWATLAQAERYGRFAQDRECSVYVAIGLFQPAEDPYICLVAPLAELRSESTSKDVTVSAGETKPLLCIQLRDFHTGKNCVKNLGWSAIVSELEVVNA